MQGVRAHRYYLPCMVRNWRHKVLSNLLQSHSYEVKEANRRNLQSRYGAEGKLPGVDGILAASWRKSEPAEGHRG